MINSVLTKDNWDTKISNIEYKDYKRLKDYDDLEEISKTYNIGKVDMQSPGITSIYVDIYAYDENSMKNLLSSNIRTGRLPENSKEIAISKSSDSNIINLGEKQYKVGDKINLNNKEYTIVGVLNETKHDENSTTKVTHGGVTYLDEDFLTDESLLDLYISNRNINKVYDTEKKIVNDLKISEKDVSYNEELLVYSLVSNSKFKDSFYLIGTTLLLVVAVSSVGLIFTTLNILLNSRKKEFGELLSIGCTKSNVRKMILFEVFILALIAIPVSFLISIGIVTIILNNITNLLNDLIFQDYSIFVVGTNIPLNIYVSAKYIIVALVFVFITIFISAIIPAIKISNISPIEAIKEQNKIKVKKNIKNKKYFFSKFISNEADIEYKYIRRSKGNTNSIIFSLVICVIVFFVGSNYITNVYARAENDNRNYNYLVYLDDNCQYEKVISDLKDKNLIKSYYTEERIRELHLDIEDDKINQELIDFLNSDKCPEGVFYNLNNNNEPMLSCTIFTIEEHDRYNEFLEKTGVKELEDGECILLNNIDLPQYVSFHVTNYKDGDTLSFLITELIDHENINEQYGDMVVRDLEANSTAVENIDLNIEKVTDNFYGYFNYTEFNDLYLSPIAVFVNSNTLKNIENEIKNQKRNFYNIDGEMGVNSTINLFLETTNVKEIDNYLEENDISGLNYEEQNNSNNSKRIIMEVFLYGFIILIGTCTFLNIFNVIFSSRILRKKEFKTLKDLGMTKKQLNKMIRFEGWYYSILSLVIGTILGIIIFIIIYEVESQVVNKLLYNMYISWQSILICVLFVLISVFLASLISRVIETNKIFKKENNRK